MAVRGRNPNFPPIRRPSFVGDPAAGGKPVFCPKPTTVRGRRRSEGTQEYRANRQARQQQSHPAHPSMEEYKGPHSRPKGLDPKEWRRRMETKHPWEE